MTAHHVPHTPLWRRVFSLPRTRLGWWAVGLAGPSLVVTVYSIVSPLLGTAGAEMPFLGIIWLVSAAVGGYAAWNAVVGRRERSWLVWIAVAPAMLFFSYIVWGLTSIAIGKDADPVVTVPLSLILAATAFLLNIRKSSHSR